MATSNLTDMRPELREGVSPASEHVTTVVSNAPVNAEYRLLVLDAPPGALRAQPGQFFHLLCPQNAETQPFLRRPMSVYRTDAVAGQIAFLYKVTGRGTKGMATLVPGAAFDALGPLGIGFTLPPERAPIVVLARGVGLATMAPLVPVAARRGHPVTAVLSARSPALMMSVDEMRADGADVIAVTDTEGTSSVERVGRLLRDLHAAGRMEAIYTCGSNRLMLLAQDLARELGLFGEIAMEQQMACGLGMCFCCVRSFREGDGIAHRRVCCEGPVFPLREALSW